MKPRCKICGHQVHTLVDAQFNVDYFLCLKCEYLFQDGLTWLSPEDEKEIYLEHENSADNADYLDRFRQMIENHLLIENPSDINVLDFGCGPEPVLAELMQTYGFKVEIFDPHFAPDQTCQQNQYDLITMTEVAEHLKDPLGEFSCLAGILKPGGKLAIVTQFHPMHEREFLSWRYRRDPTHIGFFRARTFEVISDLLSINIVNCDHHHFCLLEK